MKLDPAFVESLLDAPVVDAPEKKKLARSDNGALEPRSEHEEFIVQARLRREIQLAEKAARRKKDKVKNVLKYNMSLQEYEYLKQQQGGVCAVCHNAESTINPATGKPQSLGIDHCHETGMIRGLLCQACNRGLGFFRDNTQTLSNAIEYLNSTRKRYAEATPAELELARRRPSK